jgi:hypothetical protein
MKVQYLEALIYTKETKLNLLQKMEQKAIESSKKHLHSASKFLSKVLRKKIRSVQKNWHEKLQSSNKSGSTTQFAKIQRKTNKRANRIFGSVQKNNKSACDCNTPLFIFSTSIFEFYDG